MKLSFNESSFRKILQIAEEFYFYDWEKKKDNTFTLWIDFPSGSDLIAKAILESQSFVRVEDDIALKPLNEHTIMNRKDIFRTRLYFM